MAGRLTISVPDHKVQVEVGATSKVTIDDLTEEVIRELQLKGVALVSINPKEAYGIFLPASNTWCRNFHKVQEYRLLPEVMK